MIEEAIVDCYTEDEQHEAFLVMLEDHIECPVQARVVGEEVTLLGFTREDSFGEILAKCRRGRRIYLINVTALEWPGRPPEGSEWIEAYSAWRKGDR
jgi:hypothetical protein